MTDLTPIILTRSLKATYRLMPEFLDRVKAFDDDDWTVNIANAFEAAFCAESPIMLGIALMDAQGVMRGHCIAAIETFAGKSQAFVHQLAKLGAREDLLLEHLAPAAPLRVEVDEEQTTSRAGFGLSRGQVSMPFEGFFSLRREGRTEENQEG